MNTNASVCKEPGCNIPSNMKNVEEKLNILSDETDKLANQLNSILLPSSSPIISSEEKKSDCRSEFASQLEGFAARIQSVIYRLQDITERLDL